MAIKVKAVERNISFESGVKICGFKINNSARLCAFCVVCVLSRHSMKAAPFQLNSKANVVFQPLVWGRSRLRLPPESFMIWRERESPMPLP